MEKIVAKNIENRVFDEETSFERCNIRKCTFNVKCYFDRCNIIECINTNNCVCEKSNIIEKEELPEFHHRPESGLE